MGSIRGIVGQAVKDMIRETPGAGEGDRWASYEERGLRAEERRER